MASYHWMVVRFPALHLNPLVLAGSNRYALLLQDGVEVQDPCMAPTDTRVVEGHYCWARVELPALHVVFLDTTPLQMRECVCWGGKGVPHHSHVMLYC